MIIVLARSNKNVDHSWADYTLLQDNYPVFIILRQ